jgi:hypothetical protein
MRKLLILLFALVIMAGCGEDGKDGKAFIRINWDWYVDSFSDNNYDTPSTVSENTYYETSPGTYSYDYDCSDGQGNYWWYTGTYTITIEEGEEAGLFTDGEDGEDSYFTLSLTGFAPSKNTENKVKKAILSSDDKIDLSDFNKIKYGSEDFLTFVSGKYRMDITKQMYKLKKK